MKLPRPHYIPNDKLSESQKKMLNKPIRAKSRTKPEGMVMVRWYCPDYDRTDPDNSWDKASYRKDICPLCKGFLGEKSHREFQLEMTGEDSYAKYNKTNYQLNK